MSKYIPLEGGELTQIQFMHSLYRCLAEDDTLKERLTSIGMWWRYKGMIKQLHTMFDATWKTIDPVKRKKIDMIWSQQETDGHKGTAPMPAPPFHLSV